MCFLQCFKGRPLSKCKSLVNVQKTVYKGVQPGFDKSSLFMSLQSISFYFCLFTWLNVMTGLFKLKEPSGTEKAWKLLLHAISANRN